MHQNLDNIQPWAVRWQGTDTPHKCLAMALAIRKNNSYNPMHSTPLTTLNSPTINIIEVIPNLHYVAIGQSLGILQQIVHFTFPQSLSTIYQVQVRRLIEYSLLIWMIAASTALRKP